MITKTDELKPCPFCGCANIHITPDEVVSGGQWVGPVHVVCGGDCVAGQSGDDRESAIAAWNRRAALQSQDREDSFSDGVLLALQMITAAGDAGSHLHFDLIKTAGLEKIVRRAMQEGMWGLAGLDAPMSNSAREAINRARRVEGES